MIEALVFSCRCGRLVSVGLTQPPPCRGCEYCGTVLSSSRVLRTPMIPHDWYEDDLVIAADGRTIPVQVCRYCSRTIADPEGLRVIR